MRVNFVKVWRVCNRRRHRYEQRELSQRFSSTVADKFDGVGAVSGHGAIPLITGCAFDRANVRDGARTGNADCIVQCPFRVAKQETFARIEVFSF